MRCKARQGVKQKSAPDAALANLSSAGLLPGLWLQWLLCIGEFTRYSNPSPTRPSGPSTARCPPTISRESTQAADRTPKRLACIGMRVLLEGVPSPREREGATAGEDGEGGKGAAAVNKE